MPHSSLNRPDPKIPILQKDATLKEIQAYLNWLANSPYAYHIDDNPSTIETFSPENQRVLQNNSDIMWNHPETNSTLLWDFYPVIPTVDQSIECPMHETLIPTLHAHISQKTNTQNPL